MAARMAICVVCDRRYNPYAAFVAASVRSHPENADFDIFIFSDGFSEAERSFFEAIGTVHPVEVGHFGLPFKAEPDNVQLSMATLYTFYLDKFLPPGYTRVVSLDCDIFVDGSISPLANLDLEGHAVAAVRGLGTAGLRSARKKLDLERYWHEIGISGDPVLNAGVLLIDLDRWRTVRLESRLVTNALERPGTDDEEAFNIVLQHDWLEISPRWNFFSFQLGPELEAALDPVIIHYIGAPKPWNGWFWYRAPSHRERYVTFFKDSPWPRAASTWPPRSKRWRIGARKAAHLLLSHRKRWLRKVVIDLYNDGIDSDRFADHRQGLTQTPQVDS